MQGRTILDRGAYKLWDAEAVSGSAREKFVSEVKAAVVSRQRILLSMFVWLSLPAHHGGSALRPVEVEMRMQHRELPGDVARSFTSTPFKMMCAGVCVRRESAALYCSLHGNPGVMDALTQPMRDLLKRDVFSFMMRRELVQAAELLVLVFAWTNQAGVR